MLEIEPDSLLMPLFDCCSLAIANYGRFSTLRGGAVYPLVDRQKIVAYALVLAKFAVFSGLLSHIIGGQMSSDPLLAGR